MRIAESLAAGAAGGLLAWMVLGPVAPLGASLPWIGAAAASLNGVISGAAGIYSWRSPRGWACFALDSTWGLLGVTSGLLLQAANLLHRSPGYLVTMSRRSDRHVYEGGFSVRAGFVLALGNVVSAGGGSVGLRGDSPRAVRRRCLVDVHEGTHLFQNRFLGPIYVVVYMGWFLVAGAAGLLVGMSADRRNWRRVVETFAYYNNPFEYWAYRRDDYWPPYGAHPSYVWGARRPPLDRRN